MFAHKLGGFTPTTPERFSNPGRALFSGRVGGLREAGSNKRMIGTQAVPTVQPSISQFSEAHREGNAPPALSYDYGRIPVHAGARPSLQPKLKVNLPGDKYEQEADRVARQVTHVPDAGTTGGPSPPRISTGGRSQSIPDFDTALAHSRGGGQSLHEGTRDMMESRLGMDLSQVRVHTGPQAATMNEALGARAFTYGTDIYFHQGQYQPGTTAGLSNVTHP